MGNDRIFASLFRPHPLLVLVLVLPVAVITFYQLRSGYQRSRQKASMHNMSKLAIALRCYTAKHGRLPEAVRGYDVVRVLQPFSSDRLEATDGWNRPLIYRRGSTDSYKLVSLGSDSTEDSVGETPGEFERDIVVTDGQFTNWPEGLGSGIWHTCGPSTHGGKRPN